MIVYYRDRMEVVSRSLGVLFVVAFARNKLTLTIPEMRDQATDDAVSRSSPSKGTKDLFGQKTTDDGYEIAVGNDDEVVARIGALLEILAPSDNDSNDEEA